MHSGSRITSLTLGIFLPLSLILVLQAAASHALSVVEADFPLPGLQRVPVDFARWKVIGEDTLQPEITATLKPDEYILRTYQDKNEGSAINLFVAYFRSLQNAYGPHSPRVCLPGSGWLIRAANIRKVDLPGREEAAPVNDYVLEKGAERILVLYWYQNNRNVWAEEFNAKLTLLPDLIRYRRSDVSLVRIIAPIRSSNGEDERKQALSFAQSIFPELKKRFSGAE